jgi:hypothetical protein
MRRQSPVAEAAPAVVLPPPDEEMPYAMEEFSPDSSPPSSGDTD